MNGSKELLEEHRWIAGSNRVRTDTLRLVSKLIKQAGAKVNGTRTALTRRAFIRHRPRGGFAILSVGDGQCTTTIGAIGIHLSMRPTEVVKVLHYLMLSGGGKYESKSYLGLKGHHECTVDVHFPACASDTIFCFHAI